MLRSKKVFLLLLILFCFLLIYPVIVSANPIPVYPDPKPHFSPQTSIADVQEGSFIIWLLLVWLLDTAINTLFLYAGFLLLVRLKEETYRWFDHISRKNMILGIFVFSSIGIISEWLIGSWLFGMIIIALVVFLSAYLLGRIIFSLNSKSSFILALFMVLMNIVTWTIIFSQ